MCRHSSARLPGNFQIRPHTGKHMYNAANVGLREQLYLPKYYLHRVKGTLRGGGCSCIDDLQHKRASCAKHAHIKVFSACTSHLALILAALTTALWLHNYISRLIKYSRMKKKTLLLLMRCASAQAAARAKTNEQLLRCRVGTTTCTYRFGAYRLAEYKLQSDGMASGKQSVYVCYSDAQLFAARGHTDKQKQMCVQIIWKKRYSLFW